MKKLIYGSNGENGFGTIFGIGADYDEAHADALQNLDDLEEGVDVDFFCVDCTEAVYDALEKDGGNDIYDERFALVGELLKAVEEVTLEDIRNNEGSIDLNRNRSIWVTTVGIQLENNSADKGTPGYEEWADLDDDAIIVMYDDGTWRLV